MRIYYKDGWLLNSGKISQIYVDKENHQPIAVSNEK